MRIQLGAPSYCCTVEESGRPRLSHKQKIVGSNPTRATKFKWGLSANGNTVALQASIKGSIPLGSTIINGECSGKAGVLCKESEIGSSPIFSTSSGNGRSKSF